MGQMRMFRDRMVSTEQTLEGGEKHLELLKQLCRESFPDFEYRAHVLDHERDLFVMTLESADGRRKDVCWTRMMLFDAERIPSVVADPAAPVRGRIVDFLRARGAERRIVVTFRHLEDGWTDTPTARPGRRRRRRGRGAGGAVAGGRPGARPGGSPPRAPELPGPRAAPRSPSPRSAGGPPRGAPTPVAAPRPAEGAPGGEPRPAGSRRRFRRRRRGRGGGGPKPPAATPSA